MPRKTNAMRILDSNKISYKTVSYDDDGEHKLEKGAAQQVAQKLGINAACVFKTIVMRTETKEICVFCQSAISEINLKKARSVVGCSEISAVKPAELLALTGYVRGGCSPIGMKKKFRTFLDSQALNFDSIYISAGVRGENIVLSPKDLIFVTQATVCDLVL